MIYHDFQGLKLSALGFGMMRLPVNEDQSIDEAHVFRMVDYALERMGPDNGRVVYVGDSEVDLATAANAELDCITVTWGFRDRELLEERGATRFADTVEELLDWIIG